MPERLAWAGLVERQRERLGHALLFDPELYEPLRARSIEEGVVMADAAAALAEALAGRNGARVLLVGEAGSGKTFLLREALRRLEDLDGGPAPILVTAAMSGVASGTGRPIDAALEAHFEALEAGKMDVARLRLALAERRAVLLLDCKSGSAADAAFLGAMLSDLPPSANVVLACRKADIDSLAGEIEPLRAAAEGASRRATWEVLPLDRAQIRRALARRMPDEAEAQALVARLEQDPGLLDLVANPHFLSALAAMAPRRSPSGDGSLLETFCLEANWHDERMGFTEISLARREPALAEHLAAETLVRKAAQAADYWLFELEMAPERTHRIPSRMARFIAALSRRTGGQAPAYFVKWASTARRAAPRSIEAENGETLLGAFGLGAPSPTLSAAAEPMAGRSFRGRSLRGKDLRGADLRGADLTDADLSFSSLDGADLRGAKLDGAKLRAARLLGAKLDMGALDHCDTFGAALAVPDRVDPMIAPLGAMTAAAFHPSGLFVATAHGRSVGLWNAKTGSCLRVIACKTDDVVWSPDGRRIATTEPGAEIRDAATGAVIAALPHDGGVTTLVWSPHGLCTLEGPVLRIFDGATFAERRTLRSPVGDTSSTRFAWSGDGALIGRAFDCTVQLWDARTGAELRAIESPAPLADIALSPDGRLLAGMGQDGKMRFWDTATADLVSFYHVPREGLCRMAFSQDWARVAVGVREKVLLMDAARGTVRSTVSLPHSSPGTLASSPDGRSLAIGGEKAAYLSIRLVDRETEQCKETCTLRARMDPTEIVGLSEDGVLHVRRAGTVSAWDVRAHTPLTGPASSPERTVVATQGEGGAVSLRDAASGAPIASLVGLANGWAAFTEDGHEKHGGNLHGLFWHAIGLCRFEPGELDAHLAEPLSVPVDKPLPFVPPGPSRCS